MVTEYPSLQLTVIITPALLLQLHIIIRWQTVDNASNIGTYSTQVTGTTTAGAGLTPTLLLHLDNDFTDSSGNGLECTDISPGVSDNNNGFVSPGKWGTHGLRLNYPTDNTATGDIDFINVTDNPLIQMNTSVGFSVSFWIYPVDLTTTVLQKEC